MSIKSALESPSNSPNPVDDAGVKRIFITGASGCVGHCIVEILIHQTNHELFLLLRNPDKLQINVNSRPGVHVVQGDLQAIENWADLLATMDVAILTATAWGDPQLTFDINVVKTLKLMTLLDPQQCQQVIYFSTESILDHHNRPLKEAGEIGTDYIRSKYICHQKLKDLAIAPRITTLFPTLVFGGDKDKPYSHISLALADIATKWTRWIRFFQADGSFHIIHAKDIAQIVYHLVDHPPAADAPRELVLGNPALTVNQAVEDMCDYLGYKVFFRIPLSTALADVIISAFNIRMAAWDRFCLTYRHFTHENPISPESFGMETFCPTVGDLLRINGVPPG
ncbi:MAG: NAD(P)-dependent oxidoreductase [Cyanobacteria bacterium P01_A01_bin.123]